MKHTVLTMLLAQGKYIEERVVTKNTKKIFIEEVQKLHKMILLETNTKEDLESIRMVIKLYKDSVEEKTLLNKLKVTENYKRDAQLLLVDVINDIVDSIELRFITGGEKIYTPLLNASLGHKCGK